MSRFSGMEFLKWTFPQFNLAGKIIMAIPLLWCALFISMVDLLYKEK